MVEDEVGIRADYLIDDFAVDEEDHPVCVGGGIGIVGDHHDGLTEFVDRSTHERQNLVAGDRVEVAGGFIREDDLGAGRKRSAYGHSLLLAPRQLVGAMADAIGKADGLDDLIEPGLVGSDTRKIHWKGDVFQRGECGYKIEGLEHEADVVSAQQCEVALIERAKRRVPYQDVSARE